MVQPSLRPTPGVDLSDYDVGANGSLTAKSAKEAQPPAEVLDGHLYIAARPRPNPNPSPTAHLHLPSEPGPNPLHPALYRLRTTLSHACSDRALVLDRRDCAAMDAMPFEGNAALSDGWLPCRGPDERTAGSLHEGGVFAQQHSTGDAVCLQGQLQTGTEPPCLSTLTRTRTLTPTVNRLRPFVLVRLRPCT